VVIPAYNSGQRIAKTLAVLRQQTFVDFEVLCLILKRTTRLKHAPKVFAMTHGYRFFSAYCQWLAQLRRIRRWISCRSGKPRGTPA
jgi:hypothetical protein